MNALQASWRSALARRPSRRRVIVAGVLTAILALFAFWGWQYWMVYRDLTTARDLLHRNGQLMGSKLMQLSPPEIDKVTHDSQSALDNIDSARSLLHENIPYRLAGYLPWVNGQENTLSEFLQVAHDLSQAGVAGSRTLRDAPTDTSEGNVGTQVVALTQAHEADLRLIYNATGSALATSDRLQSAPAWGPLASARNELQTYRGDLEDLQSMASFGLLAPQLLGAGGDARYLLLGLNNGELMPGGGFIGNYATLDMQNGEVANIASETVYALYAAWKARPDYQYVEPPAPLKYYLLKDFSWGMGEAAWYPDFPTTATTAQFFLGAAGHGQVGGVVGLSMVGIERLMAFTGPVDLPDQGGLHVTAYAVALQLSFDINGKGDQKAFNDLLKTMVDHLLHTDRSRWQELWQTMRDLGRQKDFLLYFNDASAQQATSRLGWDGTLTGGPHDSVLIADASLLSSKLNFALQESADLNVDLASGNATHRLTVTYSDVFDTWKKGKDPRLADQVPLPLNEQGIYAQVFAPPSSVLLGLERKEVDGSVSKLQPESQGTFLGYQYFATFFQLALNQEKSLTYTYVAPAFLQIEGNRITYELQFHKQIGVPAYPVTFTIVPPPGYRTIRTAVCTEGAKSCAESADPSGKFDLATDTVIDVEFRRN